MVIFLILILLLALVAECLHIWRISRLRDFLFHACRFPWSAVSTLAAARIAGFALVAIATINLWSDSVHPAALNSIYNDEETDRLLILLDRSLSMNLEDAGPEHDIKRGTRAADLIRDLLTGNGRKLPRTSLVVFADQTTALAIDTNDWNVIWHSLNNRFLSQELFDDKKTTLGAVLQEVCKDYAEKWPDRSTTLLLITDGDSEDRVGAIKLPASIRRSLVVGVGSAEGKLIGDFQSRQDERTLQSVAKTLGGRYFNCNETEIPEQALGRYPLPAEDTARESAKNATPIGERSSWILILLGAGIMLLVAATLAGPFLNPSNATPMKYEKPTFLS